MMATSRWTLILATGATGTALSLSILAGWQRGGTLPERIAWVAIGIVLVVCAHLLPALLRESSFVVRGTGSLLWVACLAAACYGHTVFFVLAQQHAGDRRAATVTAMAIEPAPVRSLTTVMGERAAVTRQLAWAGAQHCLRDCAGHNARRVTLAARLDALDAEAGDIRRLETERDRVAAQRDALLADPVTSRLAALLGVSTNRIDLLSGLAFAAVLEGVACLLWTAALRESPSSLTAAAVTGTVASGVTPCADATGAMPPAVTASVTTTPLRRESTRASHTPRKDRSPASTQIQATDDDLTRLARDIDEGLVRPTVADIRRHLGCSQSRATSLRRQLTDLSPMA